MQDGRGLCNSRITWKHHHIASTNRMVGVTFTSYSCGGLVLIVLHHMFMCALSTPITCHVWWQFHLYTMPASLHTQPLLFCVPRLRAVVSHLCLEPASSTLLRLSGQWLRPYLEVQEVRRRVGRTSHPCIVNQVDMNMAANYTFHIMMVQLMHVE